MYTRLSDGTECRVKWAVMDLPYVDIGTTRYYMTKKDLVHLSDMLNVFIKSYWEDFSPNRINDEYHDGY